ncbi:MAG: hypothetical protein ACTSSI_08460 [Candidatus Helarchaeota archaeon]
MPTGEEIVARDIKQEFTDNEIECMIKIYRWIKSERNHYFFQHVLKKIPRYKKCLKKFLNKYFIHRVKGRDLFRINDDGIRTFSLVLELRLKNLL